jgi:hypothetical protein
MWTLSRSPWKAIAIKVQPLNSNNLSDWEAHSPRFRSTLGQHSPYSAGNLQKTET